MKHLILELEDIVDNFLKNGLETLKTSKMMDAFNIIVSTYDCKYQKQENEYLKTRFNIYTNDPEKT